MNKNNLLFLLFYLFSAGIASAQQLTPNVVSSSGGFYDTPSGMLSFTTGELTAIETYFSPFAILTQGFQQPWDLGTYINDNPGSHFSFRIFPNPSDGNFYLVTDAPENKHISLMILDILGEEILQTEFYHQGKITVEPFDLSFAAQGMYLATFSVTDNSLPERKTYFIEKIQIIK